MKKQTVVGGLMFFLLLVPLLTQAMGPAAFKLLRRISKGKTDVQLRKPKGRPYPIGLYPGSGFIPEPPAPITPIEPIGVATISPSEALAKTKKEEEQRFQQISILPLPKLNEAQEDVLVLDTSFTPRERLHKQMLEKHKENIVEVLDTPVMALVDENIQLDPDWALTNDMRNLFVYFNNQVNALTQYVAQFAPDQCPQGDNYCNELIEQIKQLQKQLKIYLEALSKQLSL